MSTTLKLYNKRYKIFITIDIRGSNDKANSRNGRNTI